MGVVCRQGHPQLFGPLHIAVRDAVMLGLAFGHVLLVARLTLLRSVKSVRYGATACSKEGCVGLGCKGNRLEGVPNPSLATTSGGANSSKGPFSMSMEQSSKLFKLCCAHHKNSNKGVPGFEVVITSPQLHALLVVYEGSSRSFLLRHAEGLASEEDDPSTLFFSLTTGQQLTPKQLDNWFRDLQIKHDLALSLPMPQSFLRRIFTTDRREHPSLPGPSDAGAAVGMGNSTKVSHCVMMSLVSSWRK